jgi:hypothetical protein
MLLGACLAGGRLQSEAGAGEDVHVMIEGMHTALLEGKPDALRAFFDPAMPGFKHFSEDIGVLLRDALAPSAIDFLSNTGDDLGRDVELDWRMDIRADSGEWTVKRRARVKLHTEKQDGHWRITSFAPLTFFAPAKTGDVWDAISEALGALTEVSGDRGQSLTVPAAFLAAFDKKMPSYDQLHDNVSALIQQGDIESFVELVGSEGDDRRRSLELDWTLSVVQPHTQIGIFRRHQVVKCEVERQGKKSKWRIVALEPLEFLAPEKPAK